MKKFILTFLFTWITIYLFAQKKLIDSDTYDHFAHLDHPMISNDGRYVAYNIYARVNLRSDFQIVVKSIKDNWETKIQNVKDLGNFTSDSRFFVFKTKGDSLGILNLKQNSIIYIVNVSSFELSTQDTGELLLYLRNGMTNTVVIRNLKTGIENSFSNVETQYLSENGKMLLLKLNNIAGNGQELEWVNLVNKKTIKIWKGKKAENLHVDFKHKQIAFNANDSIMYFKVGMTTPICLVKSNSSSIPVEFDLGAIGEFSQDGKRLFINFEPKRRMVPNDSSGSVEVWSYTDVKLYSQNKNELNLKKTYKAVIRLVDHQMTCLQQYDDEFGFDGKQDSLFLTYHTIGNGELNDWSWIYAAQRKYDLVNGTNGQRQNLDWLNYKLNPTGYPLELSPEAKYIVYYDYSKSNYYSYNINSGELKNLTKNIHTSWSTNGMTRIEPAQPRGVAGWLKNDEAIFIYDSYDIWELDPLGIKPPINLTNGYGLNNSIVFNLELGNDPRRIISKTERLILSAFNSINKNNGFFSKKIGVIGNPEILSMGAYLYKTNSLHTVHMLGFDFTPMKAKNVDIYIVRRMSDTDAPNYFSTTNFKTFTRLSNLQPHTSFNWYKSELHTWKSLDGRDLQGILYMPENFDATKKYPVIFYYYERLSDGLNAYIEPESTQGQLDIPTFVSNGYLVFCPDIYYKIGDPMQGTYDALVSAAKYVSTLSFVDSKKMGIQGHSFGGIQTNHLVAHTNIFAAACSASGFADWISLYGSLSPEREEPIDNFSSGSQNRMNSSLCGNLEGFIKNSAILYADKVTTPFLMMQTKKDNACPYYNAREFFLGLRRLGKRVWMLAYSEGEHTVHGKESQDFGKRMMQFFDHYLKDKPAPIWMLNDGFLSKIDINRGLELDSLGRTPGPGILTPEEQIISDSLMVRKPLRFSLK